jgi:DNA-binding IclR family transcriptional regulator
VKTVSPMELQSSERDRSLVQSLVRAFGILSLFKGDNSDALGLSDISRKSGLSKGTAHRLMTTLIEIGLLEQDHESRRYRPGIETLALAQAWLSRFEPRRAALPHMERLASETGESVFLGVLASDGSEVIYIEKVESRRTLKTDIQIGSRLPAHCTSIGKAILAFMPPERVLEIFSTSEMVRLTQNTLTRVSQLIEQLQAVRAQGFAVNVEESTPGVCAVASPIYSYNDHVEAAINVSVPSARIDPDLLYGQLAQQVVTCASEISAALGAPRLTR